MNIQFLPHSEECLQFKNKTVLLEIISIDCANHMKCINKLRVTKCKVLVVIAHGTLVTTVLRRLRIIVIQFPVLHARQTENQNLTLNNCSRHKNFSNLLR